MLRANATIINTDLSTGVSKKRNRKVIFDEAALKMAEEHENRPSLQKERKYRQVVKLGSASSWDKFNLDLFHVDPVDFPEPLPQEVNECAAKEKDPLLETRLGELRAAAKQITALDLDRYDEETRERIYKNPLRDSFQVLRTIVVQQSKEAQARESKRRKEVNRMKVKAAKEAELAKEAKPAKKPRDLYGNQLGLSRTSAPSAPPTPVTPVKRKASDSSYGKHSTESTPKRFKAAEVEIQNLQNHLVHDVLNALYHDFEVPVPWARNREMKLMYQARFDTYFKCNFPDNVTDKCDYVEAIADGAMVFVTNKVDDPKKLIRWNKQRACFLFEAKKLDVTARQLANLGGEFIAKAEASKRAAQIFAEMLGLVCHRGFIEIGEQMVFVMNLSGLTVSFYWARFSAEYLQTVRLGNLSDLKNTTKIKLHHSKPRSLRDPTQRDYFLGEFVSILRCVAEGYGKVGYLRRHEDTAIHRVLTNIDDENAYSETSVGDDDKDPDSETSVNNDDKDPDSETNGGLDGELDADSDGWLFGTD